ncbi:MAG: hypothetical protein IAF08_08235 [Rhizobacter sp.]|nr:hypothetical protein [Chlorobiales bacterium]
MMKRIVNYKAASAAAKKTFLTLGLCLIAPVILAISAILGNSDAAAQVAVPVPADQRGRLDAEREGTHDANNIRTIFYNYGMVGNYFGVGSDLSVNHSVEIPKGTGVNYTDGTTPFILAKVKQRNNVDNVIMETGYRERQTNSPFKNRLMRFEPRPGYFQADPGINRGRSIAISNDPRTWPGDWPDKGGDMTDPGWRGSWNGYFGKAPAADQESFSVMDDDFYDYLDFYPDFRDTTRRGLGLRIEVRGFQWANPQAGNVVFWHYDVTNESTTEYKENIVFGLYFDAGVGGGALSCDGVPESDDDNAAFDTTAGLNLVYTWDNGGRGVGLTSNCVKTGYLGYAYLETPGKPFDAIDNDNDGIRDESRDSVAGRFLDTQDKIRDYVNANYNLARFESFYGPLANRPAYKAAKWWTGDEDMDWNPAFDDNGVDGVPGTKDTGEGDGQPTQGEKNFGQTDLNESDQIGLTGFKFNKIGKLNATPAEQLDTENMNFYNDGRKWVPETLYNKFTSPDSNKFDAANLSGWNFGFFFASGPFTLKPGQTERFSLALVYASDLQELRNTTKVVGSIYDANYQFAVPPPTPKVSVQTGYKFVRLTWDDAAEQGIDPVSNVNDFEGYRIYKSTDPAFLDTRTLTDNRGNPLPGNGVPVTHFDLKNGIKGSSKQLINGVAYDLGDDNGLSHTWTDTAVVNGQQYYYAVCAYDRGYESGSIDSLDFYPSENSIAVSRTPRGGVILPQNVVIARPNIEVAGQVQASASGVTQITGTGIGSATVKVVNANLVPDNHTFNITFNNPSKDSIKAASYNLIDATTGAVGFTTGYDFSGDGSGQSGFGILPSITTLPRVQLDSANTRLRAGAKTNVKLKAQYLTSTSYGGVAASDNYARTGYPSNIVLTFADTPIDTSVGAFGSAFRSKPVKFRAVALTDSGERQLKCVLNDPDAAGSRAATLSSYDEFIDITTTNPNNPSQRFSTWRISMDSTGLGNVTAPISLAAGDVFDLKLVYPFTSKDTLRFTSTGLKIDESKAKEQFALKPYVVPNPYVGSASFEPERFAVAGRGDRRIEFRRLPAQCTIRIYTLRGELVQTLVKNGSTEGFIAWNLRTKDNLDIAPGLYIYHVDAGSLGTVIDKFAIIK